MTTIDDELWGLTWTRRHIDADVMAQTLARALDGRPLEFRTRVLVRDALDGLEQLWGTQRLASWGQEQGIHDAVRKARQADVGPTGFHSMGTRLMNPTSIETVRSFLRDLGIALRRPARIEIGGAIALLLREGLSRSTEDINVVDGLPAELRDAHDLLRELAERHSLILSHFQSHYLPSGWRARTWPFGLFENLDAVVVDSYDVLTGKLFSKRSKDFNDLRELKPRLEWSKLRSRVATSTDGFRSDASLLKAAERNWYVLTGDPLPPSEPA